MFKKIYRLFAVSTLFFLTGCIGSLWTGAGLVYDRHQVINTLSDYQLFIDTTRALFANDALRCHLCHLDVTVFNGDILVAGHLESEEMRQEAYRRLSQLTGYRRLFKEISVQPIRVNIAKDSWITAKIRSKIVADSEIDPRTFKIITTDQIVYLMGDVMSNQAQWVTDIARNTDGVIRVVKLFKYYHLSDKA